MTFDDLYNLREDPQETRNVIADPVNRGTVERLQNELFAWHRPGKP